MVTLALIASLTFWEAHFREWMISNIDNPFRLPLVITPIEHFDRELLLDGYYHSGINPPWASADRYWDKTFAVWLRGTHSSDE